MPVVLGVDRAHVATEVSPRANTVANDDASLIEPVAPGQVRLL